MRKYLKETFRRFADDESGLSAVEYGLLAAGIAVGLWTLIQSMGTSLHTIYSTVQGNLSTAAGAGGSGGSGSGT